MREKKFTQTLTEIETKLDYFVGDFAEYLEGTRVFLLLQRGKEGGHQNSEHKRRALRLVTHTPDSAKRALRMMLTLQATTHPDHRVYMSVNPRSIKNAEHVFKRDMLEVDFESGENKQYFFERLEDRWISAMMKAKPPKWTMRFIIDVDQKDDAEALSVCHERGIHIFTKYPTKQGWHLITEPFNIDWMPESAGSVHRDGLLLVSWI